MRERLSELGHLALRDRELERSPFARLGFNPDASAMALGDSSANGQANPGPWHLSAVKTLEHAEDALMMRSGDTDAIVLDGKHPFIADKLG